MSEPLSIANAEHYTWGGICEGWHLVRGEKLSVIEERMPPGTQEQRHFHVRAYQFFYVLEGELTIDVGDRVELIKPSQGLEILPGQPHQAINRSSGDVRFLVVSQPSSHGDRQTV